MPVPLRLSKADVRRALAAYHIRWGKLPDVFDRLRSIQYDPLSPVGCNHDLVLQARIKDYQVGEWQKAAYDQRLIYDGWDKQASLIPYAGWNARRVIHTWQSRWFDELYRDHPGAIEAVLKELQAIGPMSPRDFEFQEHRPEWKGSWYGPSLTKQTLRALWHSGRIMTHSRRSGQHVYDLTERVVPAGYLDEPRLTDEESVRAILRDRHRGVGLIRPTASYEVWAMDNKHSGHRAVREVMVEEGELIPLEIEGVRANAAPKFLDFLDRRPPSRVTFIGPLDQIMWDRRMIEHLFGFSYRWEVYVPQHLREHGYYVLPVLYGDRFIGRTEMVARNGILEIKSWSPERGRLPLDPLRAALRRFMAYTSATEITYAEGVPHFL
jgi:uncharacterized protein YcaQ